MSRYPRWLTLGQTERMRQLEEAGWTFHYGKNPDALDVLHGMRVTTKLSDTVELWKNPEATSVLRRWRENEGPHLHPTVPAKSRRAWSGRVKGRHGSC